MSKTESKPTAKRPATKTVAPATDDTTTQAQPAEELAKPKREVMSLTERFEVMTLVKEQYQQRRLTDTEFAAAATAQLGFKVAPATIKNYREAFGIEPVKAATTAELKAYIAELEAKLAAATAPHPDSAKTSEV